MIDYLPDNTTRSASMTVAEAISKINPKVAITLGGMACVTIIFCIGSIVFSGCDMTLSSEGLSIKQPSRTA